MWSWWDCMRWWESSGAWDGTTSWLMFLPMMLWPIVVIGGIVLLVVPLARGSRTETPPAAWHDGRRQTPFDILRERFARGEIDRQEYEDRKALLSRS
jgi:putative membrane protein